MSVDFYKILFFSLMATMGLVFLFYGYRYFIRFYGARSGEGRAYARLIALEPHETQGWLQIRFVLPADDSVRLILVNEQDETVKEIHAEAYPEGEHMIKFDSSSVPNGTYYIRLFAKGQVLSQKARIENS